MPPDVCPGAFLLVKASLRGDAAEQRGGARGGEVPASNGMCIKSLIYQGFAMPPDDVSGGILRFWERRGKGFFYFFVPQT